MNRSMAPCGLVCEECPAYIATRANDTATLIKCGQEWGQGREIKAEEVMCEGCRQTSGKKCFYCRSCALAGCQKSPEFETCAHCPDYPCDKVSGVSAPLRKQLETIRSGLSTK